ncbi:TNF receptor-associated factor 3-like [Sycon ciliatum]|uniref:TNF receptor-associated factor 3-like n=1 Tax=Sycon ciliatum TaxID=27933 RepID=UPI0031F6CC4C
MASMSTLKQKIATRSPSPSISSTDHAKRGHDLETVNKLDERYKCTYCKFILNQPMQLSCGDRFCRPCSNIILSKVPPKCPLCDETLENEGFKDTFAEREVQAVPVYCRNRKEGCTWSGPLRVFQEHYDECSYLLEPCTNEGCMQMLPKSDLALHLKSECVYRKVTCSRCGLTLTYQQLATHEGEQCAHRLLPCDRCGQQIQANEIASHLQASCPESEVPCEFEDYGCSVKVKRRQMEAHLSQPDHMVYMLRDRSRLKNEVSSLASVVSQLQQDMQMLRPHSTTAGAYSSPREQYVTDIPRQSMSSEAYPEAHVHVQTTATLPPPQAVGALAEKVDSLQTEVTRLRMVTDQSQQPEQEDGRKENMETRVKTLEGKVSSNSKSIGYTDVQMADLGLRVDIIDVKSTDGVLVWKIGDIARRTREAQSGRTPSLYSAPFYTSPCGYKMCARVYLNGDGMGKNKCVSLFFVLMRGEYDALLPWPFQQRVSMIMMDQAEGTGIRRNIVEVFKPERRSASFQRPMSEMNTGSGCPMFALINVLESPNYVKDDTIFIKVIVDRAGLEPPDTARM